MATRLDISLNTGNSEDKDARENYFDQMTAMSQGIINSSFKELFEKVKKSSVPQMAYNGALGNIDGVLNAPYIMINGTLDSAAELFYVLRIESGDLMFPDGGKREMREWEIAVRTRLSDTTYDDLPDDTPIVKRRKARWRADIANKYPGFRAGDYSVQRVFCAIGSADWDRPNDALSSVYDTVTGTRIPYSTWLGRPANQMYSDYITSLLRGWARDQQDSGSSTMGIQFSLKPEIIEAAIPTFRPVYLYTQTYPYMPTGSNTGVVGYGTYDDRTPDKPYGTLAPGDYNCLVYCENVDRMNGQGQETKVGARQLPTNKRLGFTGNLAQPGPPLIPGSFVIDHRVLMQTFLLPQMQELCLATFMQIGRPDQHFNTESARNVIIPKYAIGCQLEGDQPKSADDDFFRLDRQNQRLSGADQAWYQWKKYSVQDGRSNNQAFAYTMDGAPDQPFGYGNYWIRADSEVNVKWVTGKPTLNISGSIKYDYQIAFADARDMQNPRELAYIVTASWSFDIVMRNVIISLKNDKGEKIGEAKILRPSIEGLTDGRPSDIMVATNDVSRDKNITGDTRQKIEARLHETLKTGMAKIIANVSGRFENTGKLTFPGHGELEFDDPMFTRLGSLIATVKYKKPSLDDEKMYFPQVDRKKLVLQPPSLPPPETSSFFASLQDRNAPKLNWSHSLSYNEKTRIGRLILRGKNPNPEGTTDELLLAFSTIRISLLHTPSKNPETGEAMSNKLFSEEPFMVEARPGLMREYFEAGKALFVRMIKVFQPAEDEEAKHAGPDRKFVSSDDITVRGGQSGSAPEAEPPAAASTGDVSSQNPNANAKSADDLATSASASIPAGESTMVTVASSSPRADVSPKVNSETKIKKKEKLKQVEKKVETWEPSVNTYQFEAWDEDQDIEERIFESTTQVKLTIGVDASSRAIQVTLRPTWGEVKDATDMAARGFIIPNNREFEIQMQGNIEHLGLYAIKIQEDWFKVEDNELKADGWAIDYKMIDLKLVDSKFGGDGQKKVVVDEYDLSDRLAAEKKKRDEAEKTKQTGGA